MTLPDDIRTRFVVNRAHPAVDPIASFQHPFRQTRINQRAHCCEASYTGANYRDVDGKGLSSPGSRVVDCNSYTFELSAER